MTNGPDEEVLQSAHELPVGDGTLADRVRAALPAESDVREVSMFGGLSFMVDGAMAVAVRGTRELLVRTDPARHAQLLEEPAASPASMGHGRTMGPRWLTVAAGTLDSPERVAFWVGVGVDAARRR